MNLVKLAGYRINMQKSVAFLCTDSELAEGKEMASFTSAAERVRYLGANCLRR